MSVRVSADGGDFKFALQRAFIQGLNIFEMVFHVITRDLHRFRGKSIKHIGVVGVRGMRKGQGLESGIAYHFSLRILSAGTCSVSVRIFSMSEQHLEFLRESWPPVIRPVFIR